MKTYSGNKWHLVWVYEDLSIGGKSWVACHTITKPMKGGHHHLRNYAPCFLCGEGLLRKYKLPTKERTYNICKECNDELDRREKQNEG